MTAQQIAIVRLALGLRADGSAGIYRNHYVASRFNAEHDACMALVASGHMEQRGECFIVTAAGIEAEKEIAA